MTKDEIINTINSISSENENDFYNESYFFLEKVKTIGLSNILSNIISDKNYLLDVSNRSYIHVNHFLKILLVDNSPDLCRLTLHYWDKSCNSKIENEELIHNHRFNFVSLVAKGPQTHLFFSENFKYDPTKIIFKKFKYTPSFISNIHDCFSDGVSSLNFDGSLQYSTGEIYKMKFHNIHRVESPTSDSIITLVVRGPRKSEFTNTYNTFYPRDGISSNIPILGYNELQSTLRLIINELNRESEVYKHA